MAKEAVKQNAAAPTAGKATRGKKGDGPVVVSFLDNAGAVAKRVNDKTEAVRVADKSGNVLDFPLTSLSPSMRNQLIALAVAKRFDTYVRNGAKVEGSNVITLANSVADSLKSGALYSRKEGTGAGAGRPFDYAFWKEVITHTAKLKGLEATEKQLEAFEAKYRLMTPADRKAKLAKMKAGDPTFNVAYKKVETARFANSVKKGEKTAELNAMDDLF